MSNNIIAVDFDGTVVTHMYPLIGKEVPNAVRVLKKLVEQGASLILWTMRSGPELQEAVDWYAERDIPLWGVNSNPNQGEWTHSPKAYAQVYIDDAALGCPLIADKSGSERPMVNWRDVEALLQRKGILI